MSFSCSKVPLFKYTYNKIDCNWIVEMDWLGQMYTKSDEITIYLEGL